MDVTYTPCAASSREKTDYIIKLTQFEEGNIWTKTRNNAEINDDDSIMPPLLIEEDMDATDFGYESYHWLISTDMLEYIRDGSQSHPDINQR